MLKPFVLTTVHRRYFEMIANIKRYHKLKHEFAVEPSIVLVWADPIEEDEWIFESLLKNKYVDHILYRRDLAEDYNGKGTTYPESVNINLGLNFIKETYHNSYCFMQCHDIFVYKGTYEELDSHMQNGYEAVLFPWVNKYGNYATNFFVVSMNEDYWPPISEPFFFDVLERQWWSKLGKEPANTKIYTDSNRLFWHSHNYKEQVEWLQKHKLIAQS